MNKTYWILLLSTIIFFTACNNMANRQQKETGIPVNKSGKMDGNWFWENNDTTRSFKINLIIYTDSVFGEYCAATDKGKNLDCEFNTTYNMHGTKRGDSISLHFNTFFHGHDGEAVLKLQGNTLLWKITKMPVGGQCLAPTEAVMYRKLENW